MINAQGKIGTVGTINRSTSMSMVAAVAAPVAPVAEVEAPPEPAPPPAPVPIPDPTITPAATMDDALRRQYAALAAELGVTQPGLLKDAAYAFFRDRGTRLYDRAKVKAYLDDQYGTEKKQPNPRVHTHDGTMHFESIPTWGWRPLRQADCSAPQTLPDGRVWWSGSPSRNDALWREAQPYSKPVPLPVLLTVKDIVTAFPSARCFVSDEVTRRDMPVRDPFLLVVIEDEYFICERWDEPAYRE